MKHAVVHVIQLATQQLQADTLMCNCENALVDIDASQVTVTYLDNGILTKLFDCCDKQGSDELAALDFTCALHSIVKNCSSRRT